LGLLDPQVQRVQQLAELLPVRARVSACLSAVMRDGARECSMQRWLVSPMLFAAAMAAVGCSSSRSVTPAALPAATSAQAECERNGAVWRAALNFCEYQAPGSPTPVR
jgi:hypothetical protein